MELCYIKKEVISWHWWLTSALAITWSSLVEGDEQLDRPNSHKQLWNYATSKRRFFFGNCGLTSDLAQAVPIEQF